jgi:hypothetical protein
VYVALMGVKVKKILNEYKAKNAMNIKGYRIAIFNI